MVAGLSVTSVAAFSSNAFADTTASIDFTATLPETLEVTASKVIEVSWHQSAITNSSVGSINLKSNAYNGYQLTVKSTNDGVLKMSENTVNHSIPYTLSYDSGSDVSLMGTVKKSLTLENKTSANPDVLSCATNSGCTRTLTINVKESDVKNQPVGVYTDTLLFSITAN